MHLAVKTVNIRILLIVICIIFSLSSIASAQGTSDFFLHGTGTDANPATLFLNTTTPASSTAKYKDSASINFTGGNLWKEVGTWTASPPPAAGILSALSPLHVFLGLKNSDDQGTQFDVRAEIIKNGIVIASGQTLCITGITRNPASALEALVSFGQFPQEVFNGTTDSLTLRVLTRIGTNPDGTKCPGHSNAVGIRLYFDAISRPSRFGATMGITTAPPAITSLLPGMLSITQGGTGFLTVTIISAQAQDILVTINSSVPEIAFVPASVTIPAGEISAPVSVSANSQGTAQIQASLNGTSATSTVSVTQALPTVVSLLPPTNPVTLGAVTTLTVTISAAQVADTTISVSSAPGNIVTVPATVTVLAGQTTAQIQVGTLALGTSMVQASLNNTTVQAAVQVMPPAPAIVSLLPSPLSIAVGATATLTSTLNAAQLTNQEVQLSVDNVGLLLAPASVTVPQGQIETSFTVTGLAVGDAVVTGSLNNSAQTAIIHIIPPLPTVVSLLPNPLSIQEGATGSFTLTINAAQLSDTTIPLTNSASTVINAPGSVIVPAGRTGITFPVTAITQGLATITASINQITVSAQIQVTPPPTIVTGLTPSILSLPKGRPGILHVSVSPASVEPQIVVLTSSNAAVAEVPANVTIPAGALGADFPVLSLTEGQSTITATLNGSSASAQVTITPAELFSLTLSPETQTIFIGETKSFQATGTYTDSTTLDLTTIVTWSSSNQSVATIDATGAAIGLAGGTTTITATSGPISTTTTLTVQIPPPPTISGFTPTSGPENIMVTISGTNFNTINPLDNRVFFNGIPAQVISVTAASLVVIVPSGATTGKISITTSGGSAQSSTNFTVLFPPTITGFTPASSPIGTGVTITGTNLDKSPTKVFFSGAAATITSLTSNSIMAVVPIGSKTGPITITTSDGQATSQTPFTVSARQDFSISAGPSIASVVQGKDASYGITIASIGPDLFSGLVDLSVSGYPFGANFSFNPRSATSNTGSILTITTSASTPAGESDITITGTATIDGIKVSRSAIVKLRVLAVGATTLKGKIFRSKESDPLPGIKVSIGSLITNSDQSGTFFFENPPIGDQIIMIDGTPASTQTKVYPVIPIPVTIATGQANELGYTLYLQEQDIKNVTPIDPTKTTIVTDPEIPDYQMTIPQGVRIIGWDGQPNTQVSVTTTTPDRLPIRPLPDGVDMKTVYLYYFGKPGGGIPDRPIEVTYPNDIDALPGQRIELWYYDESLTPDLNSNQWKKYGMGTVSPDAKKIIPDPGAGIPKFCCGSSGPRIPTIVQILNLLYGSLSSVGGDPVNMATGLLVVTKTDLVLPGRMPITITRTHRTQSSVPGPFGIGTSMNLDLLLSRVQNTIYYIMPGASRVTFSQAADGSFTNTTEPDFKGVIITQESGIYSMAFKDGMIFRFDSNGRLIEQEDRNGNKITIQRDSSGRAFRILTPDGRGLDISSDASNRITSITDPIGRQVRYTYNLQGFLDSVTDPQGNITRYAYDQGRMINITDPRNIVFLANNYDASTSRVSQQTGPTGEIYNFKYTAFGSYITESTVTDPKGNITTYRFNNFGYPTEVIDALGQKTIYERRPFTNELLSVTDPLGRKTTFTYDDKANITSITDPQGNITRFTYEPIFNRLTKITDALGNITSFAYDTRGNLIKTTDPLGNITTISYNTFGQPISVTDPLGNTTTFEYDQAGNLITTTDPLGNKTRRTYDLVSRLIQITDARGKGTGFSYDGLNRVTQITDAIGGLTKFSYDPNGNLLSVTDARNQATTYTYDSMDRLATRTDPLLRKEIYSYDLNGNMIQFSDRKGQISRFGYDFLNRRISSIFDDGSKTEFVYDGGGRLNAMTDTIAGPISFAYDNLNRLIQEDTPLGSISYAYDTIGRRTTMTASGQQPVGYSYDANSRLTSVAQGTQVVGLGYDTAGKRTSLAYPNGVTTSYNYDQASRLTRILHQGTASVIEDLSYTYDAAGNRISFNRANGTATQLPGAVQAAYDAANQQIQFNSTTPNLSYDANGNLTSQADANGTTTYSWDARNRLVSVSGPEVSASFVYDALGRRISKTISGVRTDYQYDGNDIIAESNGGILSATYLRSLNIDEPFIRQSGTNEYFHTDALGSVLALTDQAGFIHTSYSYEPFGKTTTTGSSSNPFQYTGRENDGTGLYYYRARYYSATHSRFLLEDPIGCVSGDLNFYQYALSNPLNEKDSEGLKSTKDCLKNYYGASAEIAKDLSIIGPLTSTAGLGTLVVSSIAKASAASLVVGADLASSVLEAKAAEILSSPASTFSKYFGLQVRAAKAATAQATAATLAGISKFGVQAGKYLLKGGLVVTSGATAFYITALTYCSIP